MKHTLRLVIGICLLFLSGQLYAQTATETYHQKAGNFALAFNGVAEKGYRVGYANTPYHPQDYTQGSFVFRGVEYTNVKLRTDSHTGRLLAQSPDGKFNLTMPPQEIQRAVIGDRTFVYFPAQESTLGEGYYAVLHEGKNFAIYKQCYVSNINKKFQGSIQLQEFSLKERILLLKDGKWNILTGASSFYKHFKELKPQLQAYCKEHELHLGEKNDAAWKTIAEYCETLNK